MSRHDTPSNSELENLVNSIFLRLTMWERKQTDADPHEYAKQRIQALIDKQVQEAMETWTKRGHGLNDKPEVVDMGACSDCGETKWFDWTILPHNVFNYFIEPGKGYLCLSCFSKRVFVKEKLPEGSNLGISPQRVAGDKANTHLNNTTKPLLLNKSLESVRTQLKDIFFEHAATVLLARPGEPIVDAAVDQVLALLESELKKQSCDALPDNQPNDIHIGYYNDGYRKGRKDQREDIRSKLPEKRNRAKQYTNVPHPHEWSFNPDTNMYTADESFNELHDQITKILDSYEEKL